MTNRYAPDIEPPDASYWSAFAWMTCAVVVALLVIAWWVGVW
jgi:hypothetical protein